MKFEARDIVALVVLSYCFILLYMGRDSFITATTTLILGYYFAKRNFIEGDGNGAKKK